MRRAFSIAVVGVMFAANVTAQAPAPLRPRDFRLLGLTHEADTAAVRRRLGNPRSIADRADPDYPQIDWVYRSFHVRFLGTSHISGFLLTGPGVATTRGLRVGDSRARVRQLYGEPPAYDGPRNDTIWRFRDPAVELHIIWIRFNGDVVEKIYLGFVDD